MPEGYQRQRRRRRQVGCFGDDTPALALILWIVICNFSLAGSHPNCSMVGNSGFFRFRAFDVNEGIKLLRFQQVSFIVLMLEWLAPLGSFGRISVPTSSVRQSLNF